MNLHDMVDKQAHEVSSLKYNLSKQEQDYHDYYGDPYYEPVPNLGSEKPHGARHGKLYRHGKDWKAYAC
jgi:hypothetical protein